jgi:hypothetical protein
MMRVLQRKRERELIMMDKESSSILDPPPELDKNQRNERKRLSSQLSEESSTLLELEFNQMRKTKESPRATISELSIKQIEMRMKRDSKESQEEMEKTPEADLEDVDAEVIKVLTLVTGKLVMTTKASK